MCSKGIALQNRDFHDEFRGLKSVASDNTTRHDLAGQERETKNEKRRKKIWLQNANECKSRRDIPQCVITNGTRRRWSPLSMEIAKREDGEKT
jgi:hypothetical protein